MWFKHLVRMSSGCLPEEAFRVRTQEGGLGKTQDTLARLCLSVGAREWRSLRLLVPGPKPDKRKLMDGELSVST